MLWWPGGAARFLSGEGKKKKAEAWSEEDPGEGTAGVQPFTGLVHGVSFTEPAPELIFQSYCRGKHSHNTSGRS